MMHVSKLEYTIRKNLTRTVTFKRDEPELYSNRISVDVVSAKVSA